MATCIIPAQYHLPEAVRLDIIRTTSSNHEAAIPPAWLAEVETQRQAFIKSHGDDGTSPSPAV